MGTKSVIDSLFNFADISTNKGGDITAGIERAGWGSGGVGVPYLVLRGFPSLPDSVQQHLANTGLCRVLLHPPFFELFPFKIFSNRPYILTVEMELACSVRKYFLMQIYSPYLSLHSRLVPV